MNAFLLLKELPGKLILEAHRKKDDVFMDFFAYSYIKTNEYGEITHWETHVNSDYNDFLDCSNIKENSFEIFSDVTK